MQRWLFYFSEDVSPERLFKLQEGCLLIGSAPECAVVSTAPGVAQQHAEFSVSQDSLLLRVLQADPSTLLNGTPVQEQVEVRCPANIRIGSLSIRIEQFSVPADSDSTLPLVHSAHFSGPQFTKAEDMDITGRIVYLLPDEETVATVPEPSTEENRACVEANTAFAEDSTMAFSMEAAEFSVEENLSARMGYSLQGEIARGGMGTIFSAEDSALGRKVALKVSTVADRSLDDQFLREAKVLAALSHPNIVPIHTIGVDGTGRPFYSMKMIHGRTLQWIIKQIASGHRETIATYPQQELLVVFQKVCDAVAFAHASGYLHRDLKPDNIMVGEFGEVLVMDWGLAKPLRKAKESRGASTDSMSEGGVPSEPDTLPYIEGTPQYMSPEQANGVFGGLDERSDVYSLGGILYAILAHRPPVTGSSINEVLAKLRSGEMTAMALPKGAVSNTTPAQPGAAIPAALRSVTLKALAHEKDKRYQSVEALASDIEAYQNGFATQAEAAGTWTKIRLWVGRNQTLSASAAVLALVVTGFTGRVVQKGREASEAIQSLRETAPTFAFRAKAALEDGQFDDALKAATFAVNLELKQAAYHSLRGDALQVLARWPEAVRAYKEALNIGGDERTKENLLLTETLIALAKTGGQGKAKSKLFEALNEQGRHYEAMAFGKELGEFWKEKRRDLTALPELVKQLEAKLLPVPGTDVLMSKTEFTVGEWKLYLRAEGLPDWSQPTADWRQTDEHPVVMVSWDRAHNFCEWLSAKTGKEWRMPTNAEWEAAVGESLYPWGDYYPPHWDDGNYAILETGDSDLGKTGLDGILGTAPVASFKPNALGFHDLGGNVREWTCDTRDKDTQKRTLRGGGWNNSKEYCRVSNVEPNLASSSSLNYGFRLVRK
jgi:serine/threonine protein kinase